MRRPIVLVALLLVAACSRPQREYTDDVSAPVAAVIAPAPPSEAAAKSAAATPMPATGPMMAYTYSYGLTARPGGVRALLARHEAACVASGPSVCQVIASNVSEAGEDRLSATLSLRAAPAWLKTFRDGLAGQAKSAGGRIVSASVTSDDLSRQIVDTEAALRAKTTLRDRLQGLLASRPGKLSDLLDVERELARVQGEIDATQSELAMMRARVAMSELTITYQSGGVLAPQGVFAPLGRAVSGFVGIVVLGLAAMVTVIAWIIPWASLAAAMLWLFRKPLARRFERRGGSTSETPAADASPKA